MILITGGKGMVARNIAAFLQDKGYGVLSPDREELDLLKRDIIDKYLIRHNINIVIHCAGIVGGIQANISNPVMFLTQNMTMGLNIILASKEAGIKQFINMGSSCMYPRNAPNPLAENMILQGELEPTNEGYALAKIAATKLCEYINKENNEYLYKTFIPCNLYGKYDKFDPKHSHMIPAVIHKIHNAKINNIESIEIWGDGSTRREFMYVEDLADFTYFALQNYNDIPQNINVGLGYDYNIRQYYDTIAEVVGYDGSFTYDISKPVGMKQKLVDTSLIKNMGWKAKTSLKDGIKKTYEYYKTII